MVQQQREPGQTPRHIENRRCLYFVSLHHCSNSHWIHVNVSVNTGSGGLVYGRVYVKRLYLLLYTIALRTVCFYPSYCIRSCFNEFSSYQYLCADILGHFSFLSFLIMVRWLQSSHVLKTKADLECIRESQTCKVQFCSVLYNTLSSCPGCATDESSVS